MIIKQPSLYNRLKGNGNHFFNQTNILNVL